MWAKLGPPRQVRLGHQRRHRPLARGRRAAGPSAARPRSKAADKILGITPEVLDIHDGELEPTLENRRTITRLIREWKADIVIAHRPNDYHPDHRYIGVLVQDAAYMVAVPFFCPDTPPLKKNPVFLYSSDGFQKPNPFKPDIVVALDDVIEKKLDALHELESQFYEGGALGSAEQFRLVPPASDPAARKAWFRTENYWSKRDAAEANQYRDALVKWYGTEQRQEGQARRGIRDLRVRPPRERERNPNALPLHRKGVKESWWHRHSCLCGVLHRQDCPGALTLLEPSCSRPRRGHRK